MAIEFALKSFKEGKPIIVFDNESRENEGDIILPAQLVTPEIINWITIHARGLICVAVSELRAEQLNLSLMPRRNIKPFSCMFLQSVEAAKDVTTGISAFDRAKTIQWLADLTKEESDFATPGHVFPCLAHKDGLSARQGHTEAAIHLCQLSNLNEVAVICEIMHEDGKMKNYNQLQTFAKKWQLAMISIKDILDYQR
jgi:3,4-dihydroxy 2-butanone 4-phosphate synthase/GTP cyclohydrolase II